MTPAIRNLMLGIFALALFYFSSLIIFMNYASMKDCANQILDEQTSPDNFYTVKLESKICKQSDITMTNMVLINIFSGKKKMTVFSGELADINQRKEVEKEIKIRWSGKRLLEVFHTQKIRPTDFLQSYNDLKIKYIR